jgi:hypothetical protein
MAGRPGSRKSLILGVLWAVAAVVTIGLMWLIARRFVLSLHYADSDFFSFWLGGRFVLSGLDPYQSALWTAAHSQYGAVWIPNPTYIYPLPLAMLMAPLGALDLLSAYQAWMVLSALMILTACWVIFGRTRRRADLPILIPWAAGALLFRPVIVTLRNGQLGGFLLLGLVAGCALAAARKGWLAGAAFGLLSLKPALGIPVIGLLALWALYRRRWQILGGMLTSAVGLFIMGWLYDPAWVFRMLAPGSPKLWSNFGFFPTAWGLGTALCSGRGACATWVGGGLSAAGLIAYVAIVLLSPKPLGVWEAASMAVPVALFASPYVGAYDLLLLLLPIGASLLWLRNRGAPYLLVASLPIWIDLASLALVLVAARVGLDLWGGLLDLLVLALVWSALGIPGARGGATGPNSRSESPHALR